MKIDEFERLTETFHIFSLSAVVSVILTITFLSVWMAEQKVALLIVAGITLALAFLSVHGAVKTWRELHEK